MTIGLLADIFQDSPKGASLLGLDVGKKTIGLALGDTERGLATPLETIKRTKFTKDMNALAEIVRAYNVKGFVMGYPLNMDGSEGPRAQSVRDFANEMLNHAEVVGESPWIAFWDERLSTVSVEDLVDRFVEKRKTRENSKASGLTDKLAAQVILQGALDFIILQR